MPRRADDYRAALNTSADERPVAILCVYDSADYSPLPQRRWSVPAKAVCPAQSGHLGNPQVGERQLELDHLNDLAVGFPGAPLARHSRQTAGTPHGVVAIEGH